MHTVEQKTIEHPQDKPEFYYFEVLECVRRLLLAAIIGIVSADAAAAPVLGVLICLVATYVFNTFRPFKDPSNSSLNIILANALTLFFLAALMIKMDATSDDTSDQELFGILLVSFLSAGPVLSVLEVFWDWVVLGHLRVGSHAAQAQALEQEQASVRRKDSFKFDAPKESAEDLLRISLKDVLRGAKKLGISRQLATKVSRVTHSWSKSE